MTKNENAAARHGSTASSDSWRSSDTIKAGSFSQQRRNPPGKLKTEKERKYVPLCFFIAKDFSGSIGLAISERVVIVASAVAPVSASQFQLFSLADHRPFPVRLLEIPIYTS